MDLIQSEQVGIIMINIEGTRIHFFKECFRSCSHCGTPILNYQMVITHHVWLPQQMFLSNGIISVSVLELSSWNIVTALYFFISVGTSRKDHMPAYYEGDGQTHEE